MAHDNCRGAPVRGADGVLYNVSVHACVPVLAKKVDARDTDTEILAHESIESWHRAPAQQAAKMDDHGANRYTVDPGDHGANRYTIDPGDHGANRYTIDPGDHGANRYTIDPGDLCTAAV